MTLARWFHEAGQNTTPKQALRGFQVENHHFRVREIERTGGSIRIISVGPAREVASAVLVPGRPKDQRNAGQLLHHDLLQAVESLLLQRRIGGGGILSQQFISIRVSPSLEVRAGLLANGGAINAV